MSCEKERSKESPSQNFIYLTFSVFAVSRAKAPERPDLGQALTSFRGIDRKPDYVAIGVALNLY